MSARAKLDSLKAVISYFEKELNDNPQCDYHQAFLASCNNRKYPHACISIIASPYIAVSDEEFRKELEIPAIDIKNPKEKKIAATLMGNIENLYILRNPVVNEYALGGGTRTLVTCFDLPLDVMQEGKTTQYTRSIDEILSKGEPDIENAGIIPQMKEEIDIIKQYHSSIKIALPDMQGPFNLAHAILGSEAMILPYTDEKKYHDFMAMLTGFWLKLREKLAGWIGEDKLSPIDRQFTRICECDVNLVSQDFYKSFILPYDLLISKSAQSIWIHPCSGPHVFKATLENIPNIRCTEAGLMLESKMAAGAIGIEDALAAIGGRNIVLIIGEEIRDENDFAYVKKQLDLAKDNPRLFFHTYCCVLLSKKERKRIIEFHKRINDYWQENIYDRQ